jgi:photoactive yellow protein
MDQVKTATPADRDALLARVESMSREELDLLPIGVIALDLDGNILEYNRLEGKMAHRDGPAQIGRNFFTDVAPCTATPEFEGRFRTLAADGQSGSMQFSYDFSFPWAEERVTITFLRAVGGDRIFVVVTWLFDISYPPVNS